MCEFLGSVGSDAKYGMEKIQIGRRGWIGQHQDRSGTTVNLDSTRGDRDVDRSKGPDGNLMCLGASRNGRLNGALARCLLAPRFLFAATMRIAAALVRIDGRPEKLRA